MHVSECMCLFQALCLASVWESAEMELVCSGKEFERPSFARMYHMAVSMWGGQPAHTTSNTGRVFRHILNKMTMAIRKKLEWQHVSMTVVDQDAPCEMMVHMRTVVEVIILRMTEQAFRNSLTRVPDFIVERVATHLGFCRCEHHLQKVIAESKEYAEKVMERCRAAYQLRVIIKLLTAAACKAGLSRVPQNIVMAVATHFSAYAVQQQVKSKRRQITGSEHAVQAMTKHTAYQRQGESKRRDISQE